MGCGKSGKTSGAGAAAGLGRWRAPRVAAARARPRGARFDRPPRRRVERAGEPVSDPAASGRRGGEHQAPAGIHGSELELSKPDLKRRLADQDPQLAADPLPISEIAVVRGSELLTDRVELDDDGALSFAAAVGDVVLDDRDLAAAAPPIGGLGGKGSRVLGFPSRAHVERRGLWRGFWRGLPRNRPTLSGVSHRYPAQSRTVPAETVGSRRGLHPIHRSIPDRLRPPPARLPARCDRPRPAR